VIFDGVEYCWVIYGDLANPPAVGDRCIILMSEVSRSTLGYPEHLVETPNGDWLLVPNWRFCYLPPPGSEDEKLMGRRNAR